MNDPSDAKPEQWRACTVEFHESLVAERGEGWRAFWGSQESQFSRYRVLMKHLPLDGAAVLEVGCGFGDLLRCAEQAGVRFGRYLGVDLSERTVAAAQRAYPQAEFAAIDVLRDDPPWPPDYVVASGIMAVGFPDYEEYVLQVLRRFHALGRRGFGLNFLSARATAPDPRCVYVEPGWVLQLFQRHVDWNCSLVHDYRPNDFTLIHRRG